MDATFRHTKDHLFGFVYNLSQIVCLIIGKFGYFAGSSIEFIKMPDDMVAILFSKSSAGRIGLEHLHAGFGDPGWHSSQ